MLTYNEVRQRQSLPYDVKKLMSERRVRDFVDYYGGDVLFCFSGGIDSSFGLHFVRSIYPEIKAISVKAIECKENRKLINATSNVIPAAPRYSHTEIIKRFGYPVVSKKVAKQLRQLKHPSEKNQKSRNLALTGYTSTGTKTKTYKLAKKWKFLIDSPFEISEKCCYYMKETVVTNAAKKFGCATMTATLAEESKTRMDGYCKRGGCNSFEGQGYSTPFMFWTRQDVLRYIIENNVPYSEAYGEIRQDRNGLYFTTKADRTGCPICMFGMEKDGTPNRFQRMYVDDPKMWDFAINKLDYKMVLDYFIENGFTDYQYYPENMLPGQLSLDDVVEGGLFSGKEKAQAANDYQGYAANGAQP